MPDRPTPPSGVLAGLSVHDGTAAIDFYRRAFGAELLYELRMPDGRVGHAELALAQSRFTLADEFPDMNLVGPLRRGGTTVLLSFYVDDVDAVAARAIAAGAELERPIKDEFYGDRVAHLRDPFGHRWSVHTRLEEVSPEEMRRRMAQL